MNLPFTTEQFLEVFRLYNDRIWPAQLALLALAVAILWCSAGTSRRRGALGVALLGCLWLWAGVVYHWLYFSAVNPAARMFGALFVLEGVLLLLAGVRGRTVLRFQPDAQGVLGAALVLAALVVYPLFGHFTGHPYFASPTFGAPCPLTIFTFGVLLLASGRVRHLLVVPVLWTVIGSVAFIALGIAQDVLMPAAAVLAVGMHVLGARRGAGVAAQHSVSG